MNLTQKNMKKMNPTQNWTKRKKMNSINPYADNQQVDESKYIKNEVIKNRFFFLKFINFARLGKCTSTKWINITYDIFALLKFYFLLKATDHNFVKKNWKIVVKTCIYTQNNVNFREISTL